MHLYKKFNFSSLNIFRSNYNNFLGPGSLNSTPIPIISGHVITGETLTVSEGNWSENPDSYQYQWTRDGVNIAGATSNTYSVLPIDEGTIIRCDVTGIKGGNPIDTISSNGLDTWYPGDIGTLVAWYDAADNNQIIVAGAGTNVTNWLDKSGNGYDLFQPTVSLRPSTSGSLNGKNALDFNQDLLFNLANAANIIDSSSNLSITHVASNVINDPNYVIYWCDAFYPAAGYNGLGAGGTPILECHMGSSGPDVWGFFMCDGGGNTAVVNQDFFVLNTSTSSSGPYISNANIDMRTLFPTGSWRIDGTSFGSSSFTVARDNRIPSSFIVGGQADPAFASRNLEGLLCDIVISQDLTQTESDRLEGYLCYKWGINSNLPISHPYKSAPYTVSI